MLTAKRVHYAWVICLSGTLMLFTSIGLGVNVFSAFQPHLMAYGGLTNIERFLYCHRTQLLCYDRYDHRQRTG